MLKEALIWAVLITGIICSGSILNSFMGKKIEDAETYKALIIFLFIGVFCLIYFVFRFFSFLASLPNI